MPDLVSDQKPHPVLHKFTHPFHAKFEREFRSRSATFANYHPPRSQGRPHELHTLRNYTETWSTIGEGDLHFYLTHEQERKWFAASWNGPRGPRRKKTCASSISGRVRLRAADASIVIDGEIFAVDLNLSLLAGSHIFAQEPLSIIFARRYSTSRCQNKISTWSCALRAASHLFDARCISRDRQTHARYRHGVIWIYWSEDFGGPFKQVLIRLRELAIRPVVSRMPLWLQNCILYVWLGSITRSKKRRCQIQTNGNSRTRLVT